MDISRQKALPLEGTDFFKREASIVSGQRPSEVSSLLCTGRRLVKKHLCSPTRARELLLQAYCILYEFKICSNHVLSKSIDAIFPTTCTHFIFLCHNFGNSHNSNFHYSKYYVIWYILL